MVWHLTGLEADTFLNGWTVRLAKGPLDGRVRYGKSAAGADALQNLAEVRRRMLIARASWRGLPPPFSPFPPVAHCCHSVGIGLSLVQE